MKMVLFFVVPILSLTLFFACQKKDSSYHDKLRLYLQAEPFSLDPRVGGERRSQVILRCLFEGLFRIGKDRDLEPGMAKDYAVSQDGLTYTFTLRNALWSNGEKVRAQDFCYAWKTALSPQFPSAFSYAFFLIKNAKDAKQNKCSLDAVGVKAINDDTLQVTLEHPTPYFLELTANPLFSPICEKHATLHQGWNQKTYPEYVSNGPFLLKEHEFQSHMKLEKNPLYWDKANVTASQLSFPIITHPTTAYALFERGELDWFGDPCGLCDLEIIHKMTQEGTLLSRESGGLYWIVCNTKRPYLSSPKIRCAIASSISRKDICYLLIKGGEQPASSIVPSFLSTLKRPYYRDGDNAFACHCFEEGLKEIGYTRETFPTITLTHWAEPVSRLIAQYFQERIERALHIHVQLQSCEWGTYMQKIPAGDIDLATAAWLTWVADPMFNLQYLKFSNNGINGTGWQNEQYIEFLEKAELALDSEERTNFLQKAEELAAQELPLIPLYELVYKYAKSPGVTGEVISPAGMFDFKRLEKREEKKP